MASLYGYRWQQARIRYLRANPLCRYCDRQGRARPATVVDHVTPHRNDLELFWNVSNWQPLCKPCHDAIKQAEESGGGLRGAGTDGTPLDPSHHWNR
jgi:5-methylcytosine-specific restriction protein A